MFNFLKRKKKKDTYSESVKPYQINSVEDKNSTPDIEANLKFVQTEFGKSHDLIVKPLPIHHKKGYLIYFETLISKETIENHILKPLKKIEKGSLVINAITTLTLKESQNLKEVVKLIANGYCAYITSDNTTILLMDVKRENNRNIDEPENEQVIRGSHIGFIEDLSSNIFMIRAQTQNPKLKVEYIELGNAMKNKIAIIYFENLSSSELINEVQKRIKSIKADFIQTPGLLQEYIEERTFSPFPQLLNTERPDRLVANLVDGRIGIMSDGSPTALIAPSPFISFFQSPDDYNSRMLNGSFYRLIRVISFFIAIGLPSFYIAVVSFHYEILPVELLFTVKSSLEPIPIPPILEAIFMAVTLELIREATIRLPSPVAQTIGVVGGLVIGNAVVEANLVSNMMIIVVAITALATFIIPSTEMGTSIRLLGFPLMILSALFGLIGIVFGFSIILIHLCKLNSFSAPYFSPFAPLRLSELKDTFIRFPTWLQHKRPKDANAKYQALESNNPRKWDE